MTQNNGNNTGVTGFMCETSAQYNIPTYLIVDYLLTTIIYTRNASILSIFVYKMVVISLQLTMFYTPCVIIILKEKKF